MRWRPPDVALHLGPLLVLACSATKHAGGLGMRRPRSATQRRVMPFVGLFRDGGHLTPDAGVTEIDEAIGVMRRWLERNAEADGEGW